MPDGPNAPIMSISVGELSPKVLTAESQTCGVGSQTEGVVEVEVKLLMMFPLLGVAPPAETSLTATAAAGGPSKSSTGSPRGSVGCSSASL